MGQRGSELALNPWKDWGFSCWKRGCPGTQIPAPILLLLPSRTQRVPAPNPRLSRPSDEQGLVPGTAPRLGTACSSPAPARLCLPGKQQLPSGRCQGGEFRRASRLLAGLGQRRRELLWQKGPKWSHRCPLGAGLSPRRGRARIHGPVQVWRWVMLSTCHAPVGFCD